MGEPTFASLNPSLLARKGGAKPAMRPQHGMPVQQVTNHDELEDLGWNDMGPVEAGAGETANAKVISLTPADNDVHRQQREIVQRVVPSTPARGVKAVLPRGKRAAFTLRLDSDRHLQLRLACTVKGRSAQQIVTEALDRMLAEMPDIAALAAHVNKN